MARKTPTENSGLSSEKPRGRVENLKPWPKGQSGNPGGRPKRTPLTEAYREVLALPIPGNSGGHTYAQAIAEMLADRAAKGDVRAAQELADRTEGRARQSIEIEQTSFAKVFEQMTDAELETYATSGTLPEWVRKESSNGS